MKVRLYIWLGFIGVILFTSSCRNLKHDNFQKRKYLKLKNTTVSNDPDEPIEESVSNNEIEESYIEEKSHISFEGEDGLELEGDTHEINEIEYNQSTSVTEKELIKFSPVSTNKERRDFNTLSKDEKNRAIIEFNRTFNNGLPFLIIGIVIFAVALTSFMIPGLNVLRMIMLPLGSGLVVTAWIFSMVAVHKVKKLKTSNLAEDDRLRHKINLARLMATIGVLSTLFPLLWGGAIILLILWLAKVI
ncbi:MAG: hypothetical protein MK078_03180 [Crocinitomicaceae bacterium]|nr:hypothetical protein [Crocinitomicaceae bacterium]